VQLLRDTKMEDFVYIHSQLHINHCLTGPSLRDVKNGRILFKGLKLSLDGGPTHPGKQARDGGKFGVQKSRH
jgi:hypothetical protein